jgi:ABC-type phosphate transport system substrate-binding protein
VVAYVKTHPGAIGFATLAAPEEGTRRLRVAAVRGLQYHVPDAEAVYRGDYALTRSMNLYVRPGGPALANGLVTFITAIEGQKVVLEGGLVPTSVPVRFVRRSPMLGSHE